MRSSSAKSPRRKRKGERRGAGGRILAQVRFFGLTTARVVSANFFAGDRRAAYKILGGLAARKDLYRHEHEGRSYFTARPTSFSENDLNERYSFLAHCRLRPRPLALLSPSDFAELMAGLKAITSLHHAPRFARCIHTGTKLELLRVATRSAGDLNHALGQLQRYVSSSAFEPWWHFARSDLLTLVSLVSVPGAEEELSRWLERHPLLSYFDRETPLPIPVRMVFVAPFAGTP